MDKRLHVEDGTAQTTKPMNVPLLCVSIAIISATKQASAMRTCTAVYIRAANILHALAPFSWHEIPAPSSQHDAADESASFRADPGDGNLDQNDQLDDDASKNDLAHDDPVFSAASPAYDGLCAVGNGILKINI